jgi:glutamate dehydrogenase
VDPKPRPPLRTVELDDEVDNFTSEDGTVPQDWEAVKTGDELETYVEDIADTVRIGLDQSIAILTPWFFSNMPRVYYQTTPRPEKVRHLSAIITGHVFETKQTVELWDRDRSKVTYIGPGGDRKIIVDMAARLSTNPLKMGSIYFSRDKLLFLSTFHCSDFKGLDEKNRRVFNKIKVAKELILAEFPNESAIVEEYIENLDNDFVIYATAARIQITFRMVRHMLSHEGAHTVFEDIPDSVSARITLGMKSVELSDVLEQVLHMFNRYNFEVVRAFMIKFSKGLEEPISVMHFIVGRENEERIVTESVHLMRLNKALRTLGWVDSDEYFAFTRAPFNLSINAANLMRSIAIWVHVMLGKENPYYYSNYKIRTTFHKNEKVTRQLVDLFRIRFDPLMEVNRQNDGFLEAKKAITKSVEEIIDEVEKDIFLESVNLICNMQKTNYFMPTKTGLAFRVAPEALNKKYYPYHPFGIFFIVGRDYRFFHIRWKEIARGGLRVVMPRNTSDFDFALAGLFDEVYGLSYAQQLKNKDIPEGGSKAVLLLRPDGHRHKAVRGAINAMLDLLVRRDESDEEASPNVLIDYYNKDEIIYLGPDENMTNDLIEWVPQQALRRGYRYAAAFMSSKPGAGINHKEYGVTSEGVNVFVDNALRFIGINPNSQDFTIKLTGGPDGDVAGNELKILHREYGAHGKVVAIADGFGAAFDPKGLDWEELLRLVHEGLSIDNFNPKKLHNPTEISLKPFVIKADTPENILIRNSVHTKHYADIFIPAGGRPYTVNEKNCKQFIDEHGETTCKVIVEGANIFFTNEAREWLQQVGVFIIKDSSANKTGVICSSYEIIASLTLTQNEFLKIKDVYVSQVIDILRSKADQEAKLLFQEYTAHGGKKPLVQLSMEISREINEVTDIILEELSRHPNALEENAIFTQIILDYCPKILLEKYKARVEERLPESHKIAMISAYIASYIVYREGLGWLESIVKEDRFKAAITYMEQDDLTNRLVASVDKSKLPDKEKISAILKMSAARDLTMIKMDEFTRKAKGDDGDS